MTLGWAVLGLAALAAEHDASQRRLELTNLHGGEKLAVTFHNEQDIAPAGLAALRHLLRDYRVNEEHDMAFGLFMQLTDLARQCGVPARYEVISGYRSPATNAKLRAAGHAVAERSQHMEGHAIDVRLKGCPLPRLRDLALAAGRGGVGFYPRSDFVHIDTGRVRSWHE
ncbi:MAG: DUF882 domain-containing protein [Proteobacteria bacterium]|nr:DUF882 domain-containing protein [Pseudomonadota bacterium]